MSALSVLPPYPFFTDASGAPLDSGYLYIGTVNLNPISSPVTVYWDAGLTQVASQPIRTLGGFPVRNGSPSPIYVDATDYSIELRDKNNVTISYAASSTQLISSAKIGPIVATGSTAARWLADRFADTFKLADYYDTSDPVGDDYPAIMRMFAAAQNKGGNCVIEFPQNASLFINHYIESGNGIARATLTGLNGVTIKGNGAKITCLGGWSATTGRANWGFVLANCTNVRFDNLEVDAGSETITKVSATEQYSHILDVEGCENVYLENLYFHNGICDGLIINDYGPSTNYIATKNLLAVNCRFIKNARQGMSVIQCRGATFIGCKFNQAGTASFGNYAPSAGVDVEPNRYPGMGGGVNGDEFTGDIVFINCEFKDNLGDPYVGSNNLSVIHPVTHYASRFINTTGTARYVNCGTKYTTFRDCHFDEVDFWPNYALDLDTTTRVYNCKFTSSNAASICISMLYDTPKLTIEDCEIYLLGTYASVSYRIRLATANFGNIKWRRNKVFVKSTEHDGAGSSTIISLNGVKCEKNEYTTDLATAGRNFYVVYANGSAESEYFYQPTYINWSTTAQTVNYYSYGGDSGTWTPVLNFGGATTGITYTTQSATYTRVGNRMMVQASFKLSNKGSATGNATITGLPGGSAVTSNEGVTFSYVNNMAAGVTFPMGNIVSSTVTLYNYSAGSLSNLTDASFTNTSDINFSAVYRVS